MRRTRATRRAAVPVTEGTAAGVPCLVPCFYFFMMIYLTLDTLTTQIKTIRTRHATHPSAVPMVEGDAEGGGGGDLTGGPLDGQTNRGSNPRRRRAPAMAHTTRPSMPLTLYGAKLVQKGRTAIGVRT